MRGTRDKTGFSPLPFVLVILTITGVLGIHIPSARALTHPIWIVSLDANSSSQTDVTVTTTALQSKSFRIGAVINASSTAPLTGVYGWQFAIDYNASAFVPRGDPSPSSSYPDGAANTVMFGSQTTPGTVNWAGFLSTNLGFGRFTVPRTTADGLVFGGRVYVFWTMIGQLPSLTVSAKTLLATVNFEILNKPSSPQHFDVTDVVFVDYYASILRGVLPGTGVTETVTNDPPHAQFTITPSPSLGPFAYTFNATRSHDTDDSISNPNGYFWDFGDGTQDLGVSGPIVTHDFGVNNTFTVTLRTQDIMGATGAARDSSGKPILDFQPSHARRTTSYKPDLAPVAKIYETNGCGDCVLLSAEVIDFQGDVSYDPDGVVLGWHWDFGDGTSLSSGPYQSHVYSKPGNYTVLLSVVDDASITASASENLTISPGITFSPATPTAGDNVTFDASPVLNSVPPYSWRSQVFLAIANWYWDFGDGSSNGQVFNASNASRTLGSPKVWHVYNNPGNYTVVLSVSVVQPTYGVVVAVYHLLIQFSFVVPVYADPSNASLFHAGHHQDHHHRTHGETQPD